MTTLKPSEQDKQKFIAKTLEECYVIQEREEHLARDLFSNWMRMRPLATEEDVKDLADKSINAAGHFVYCWTLRERAERMAWEAAANAVATDGMEVEEREEGGNSGHRPCSGCAACGGDEEEPEPGGTEED